MTDKQPCPQAMLATSSHVDSEAWCTCLRKEGFAHLHASIFMLSAATQGP